MYELLHGFSMMLNCQTCRRSTFWNLWQIHGNFTWVCERCEELRGISLEEAS